MNTRNPTIDILRFIGLSLIILAHVFPPNIIFNLRCFDVPLMLFVSGLAYANKKIDINYNFFIRRVKRLVIPVYTFLTGYFILIFFLKITFSIDFGITVKHVLESYLLMDGVGYVWIIRIFLMISLLTPYLTRLNKNIRSDMYFLLILLTFIIIQEYLLYQNIGTQYVIIRDFLYYATGYSFPFLLGLRIKNMKTRKAIFYYITWTLLFIICAYILYRYSDKSKLYDLLQINNYKYPPHMYYLFYGISMSIICYIIIALRQKPPIYRIVSFIGMNTIWIYLYHIPLIQITALLKLQWYTQYFIVYTIAVLVCYIQVTVIDKLQIKYNTKSFLNYFKG